MRLLCYTESHLKCAHQFTRNTMAAQQRQRQRPKQQNSSNTGIKYENEQKMIKLKDISAKLHKYFSKTFGVVNLNAEHTHTYAHVHVHIHSMNFIHTCTCRGEHQNGHSSKHAMCSAQILDAWYAAMLFVCRVHATCPGIFAWCSLCVFRLRKLFKFLLVEQTNVSVYCSLAVKTLEPLPS